MKKDERVEVWTIHCELVLDDEDAFTNVLIGFKQLLDEGTIVECSISTESI